MQDNQAGVRKNTKATDKPFYIPPSGVTTPSQIIKETKEKLNDAPLTKKIIPIQNPNSIRSLQTNRPFTPRDDNKRKLFGNNSGRALNERPSSSFSLSSKSFETTDQSRPPSGTRLSPIEKKYPNSKASASDATKVQTIDSVEVEISRTLPSPLLNAKSSSSQQKSRFLPQLTNYPISTNSRNSFDDDNSNCYKTEAPINADDNLNKKIVTDNDPSLTSGNINKSADDDDDSYWADVLMPHLNKLSVSYQEKTTELFCELCNGLYELLDRRKLLGKTSAKRTTILKMIFKFLDTDNDPMKLKLARIILALEVNSNNLTSICRLMFSLSKREENDSLFAEDDLIDLILKSAERLDFKANSDSIVYFCGTLKNLSADNKLLKRLSSLNITEILSNLMKSLSHFYKENETKKSEAGHALVQLTATLRNLADLSLNREKFITCQIIEELTIALKYYTSDCDLVLNISRIFSKLTLHTDCCTILLECQSCYKSFIKAMIKHEQKQDLIVRIGFILGNLLSRNDLARIRYVNEKHSIDTLINLLRLYLDLNQNRKNETRENRTEFNEVEDVLVKLVRVIANLAINEKIGADISSREDCLDILFRILEVNDLNSEELVVNTIVTLNNLTFYDTILFDEKRSLHLINVLMKYLLSNNYDAILEVFRVLANLSRQKAIRNYLVLRKVDGYLLKVDLMAITLLDSGNHELVYIVIGVLINLMSDDEKRPILKKEDGIIKLVEVMNDFAYIDWQLVAMVCKVLMNYSEKIYSSEDCFGPEQMNLLRNILYEFLDEKLVVEIMRAKQEEMGSEGNADVVDEYMMSIWQTEFTPVGQRLLERIEQHQSHLEPI